MRMTDSNLFLDSGIWIGYLLGDLPESREIIDSPENTLFTSIISVHEIMRKLERRGLAEKEAEEAVRFMEENSVIVNISMEAVKKSVGFCFEYGLHTIDSLIYSSAAGMNAVLVTADSHFRNVPRTTILR